MYNSLNDAQLLEAYNKIKNVNFDKLVEVADYSKSKNMYADHLRRTIAITDEITTIWRSIIRELGYPLIDDTTVKPCSKALPSFLLRKEPSKDNELQPLEVKAYDIQQLYPSLLISNFDRTNFGLQNFKEAYSTMFQLRKFAKKYEYEFESIHNLTYKLKVLINASYLYLTKPSNRIELDSEPTQNIFIDLYNEIFHDLKYDQYSIIMDVDYIVVVADSTADDKFKEICRKYNLTYDLKGICTIFV